MWTCLSTRSSRSLSKASVHHWAGPALSSEAGVDMYARLLRHVLVDGVRAAETAIAAGAGDEYTYDTPYRDRQAHRQAEYAASETRAGLWGHAREVSVWCHGATAGASSLQVYQSFLPTDVRMCSWHKGNAMPRDLASLAIGNPCSSESRHDGRGTATPTPRAAVPRSYRGTSRLHGAKCAGRRVRRSR